MDFKGAVRREGCNLYIADYNLTRRYDNESCLHIFTLNDEDKEPLDIFSINATTGKLTWLNGISSDIKLREDVQDVISMFTSDTRVIKGNIHLLQDWILFRFNEELGIGTHDELRITVTGEGLNPDQCFWIVKHQMRFSFNNDELPSTVVFAIRYTVDENTPMYNVSGEPASPQDLFIGEENVFDSEKITAALVEDIKSTCNNIHDITVSRYHRGM